MVGKENDQATAELEALRQGGCQGTAAAELERELAAEKTRREQAEALARRPWWKRGWG